MKKLWILLAAFALAIPSLALAATFQTDTTLPAGETVVGNLYLAGGTPMVHGDVQGDLYMAGGNIVVTGKVADDLVTAGGNISLTGAVGGDVRAFGGSLFLDGEVEGEVIVSGGEVKIGPNAKIRKDLIAAGGSVSIDPAATVFGSKTIESGEKYEKKMEGFREPFAQYSQAGFWIGHAFAVLAFFAIAAVYLGLFPAVLKKWTRRAFDKGQFWPNLGLGFVMLVVPPFIAALLFATGIGALLGGLVLLAYIAYILLNVALAGILFGELLKKWFTKAKKIEPTWGWALGGIALLHVVTLIPFVGWAIGLGFFVYSWGSMAVSDWKIARSVR